MKCPCGSELPYLKCCGRFHLGKDHPKTCLELMKARYSAFATKNVDFLIKTTHSSHKDSAIPLPKRRKELLASCVSSQFQKLEILDYNEKDSTVTFRVHVIHNGSPLSFEEKSTFAKENNEWTYLKGEVH